MRDRGWSCLCMYVCARAVVCSAACDGLYRLEWFDCISGTAFYSARTQSNTLNIYHCGAERCCEFGVLVAIVSKQLPNKVQMWFQNGTEVQDTHTRAHAYMHTHKICCGLFTLCLVLIITRWEGKAIADRLTIWNCFNLPWVIGFQFSLLPFWIRNLWFARGKKKCKLTVKSSFPS